MLYAVLATLWVAAPTFGRTGHQHIIAAQLQRGFADLDQTWLFQAGDDPAWARIGLDDSAWQPRQTTIEQAPWEGIGWFRLHLELDSQLQNQPLALNFHQLGAAEIYIDGRLQHQLGKVSPKADQEQPLHVADLVSLPIDLGPGPHHLIAVRYSNHNAAAQQQMGWPPGFTARLTLATGPLTDLRRAHAQLQMFFTAAALTFSVLHLLLFAFYPQARENLFYALHTLSIAVVTYLVFEIQVASIDHLLLLGKLNLLPMVLTGITGLLFVYSLFNQQLPRRFWFFLALGLLAALWSLSHSVTWVYMYILLTLLEWMRVIFRAICRRKRGARIVGAGALIFTAAVGYQMLMLLGVLDEIGPLGYVYLIGVLAMLLSMSVHLARRFGRDQEELARQLDQVRTLSTTLEQKVEERTRELQHKNIELENTNHQLKETQSQLVMQEKMASLGNLVAGVAHEINTPVGAVKSSADVLDRGLKRLKEILLLSREENTQAPIGLERTLKVLEDNTRLIDTATRRIARIVRSLGTFARLDETELQEADLHHALDTTLELVQHQLKGRIAIERDYGQLPPIQCYPGELNQVFMNLLVNAAQAINGKGTIKICTKADPNWATVKIADDGAGMPAEIIDQIFDPGFTTKGVKVGTGLGLSISYNIIQKHRGKIGCHSKIGHGTTFTVELPMDLEQEQ